jgi:hypothetical protein
MLRRVVVLITGVALNDFVCGTCVKQGKVIIPIFFSIYNVKSPDAVADDGAA